MKKLFYILIFLMFSTTVSAEEILSDEQLRDTIESGIKWLQNSQEANGHFRYEYLPFWDRYILDENMVRQTGSLFILGEFLVKNESDSLNVKKNIEKAIGYFEANSMGGEFNNLQFRCLLKTKDYCSLGGTSLALIGILDLVKSDGALEKNYRNLIKDYKNFIVAMKLPDAGFRGNYYLNVAQKEDESSFSNGEALLALVRYYSYDAADEIKALTEDSLSYMIAEYRQKWDNNFYLWGMAAIKDWYPRFPEDKYYDFVKDYTDWRIEGQKNARGSSHNKCAYIEGVVSAYAVLKEGESDEELEEYLEEINFWLTKSKKFQVKKTDVLKLVFSDEGLNVIKIKNLKRATGGFLTDFKEPMQRIDFTQHCVSSYLQKLVDIDGGRL